MQANNTDVPEKHSKLSKEKKWYQSEWLKRIGVLGFLFFLIKGLIWLALMFGVFSWFGSDGELSPSVVGENFGSLRDRFL